MVIAEVLRIFRGPEYIYDTIGVLAKGITLHIIGVDPDFAWGQIDLGFGQSGWVNLDGVDWDGALMTLPQPEPPPSPTPTFTPIPPPQVTRLNRLSGGWYLSLGGLQADETVTVWVYDASGTLVATATAVADQQGRVVNLRLSRLDPNHIITGTYNFFLTGTGGWTLSFSRTWS